MRSGNIDYRTQVRGVWPGYPVAGDWRMADGAFFSQADLNGYAPVVVLGRTVASNLFPDGASSIGSYVLIGNIPFEVIGVLEPKGARSEEHTSELQSLMRISYAFFCLQKQNHKNTHTY